MIYLKQVKREALKGRITVDNWNLHKRVFQLTLKIKKRRCRLWHVIIQFNTSLIKIWVTSVKKKEDCHSRDDCNNLHKILIYLYFATKVYQKSFFGVKFLLAHFPNGYTQFQRLVTQEVTRVGCNTLKGEAKYVWTLWLISWI